MQTASNKSLYSNKIPGFTINFSKTINNQYFTAGNKEQISYSFPSIRHITLADISSVPQCGMFWKANLAL
jgi:hypothetical protein